MSKHYYITTFNCPKEIYQRKKGFNIFLTESIIPLNEVIIRRHLLTPERGDLKEENFKLEEFKDKESYKKRAVELYEEFGKNKETLNKFITRNEWDLPVTLEKITTFYSVYEAVKMEGECPECRQETIHCTYWSCEGHDPFTVFTHTCFTCLNRIDYEIYDGWGSKCPFCNKKWR